MLPNAHLYQSSSKGLSVLPTSSIISLSNTVSVSLQLLFLSSFLLFKHLPFPLQFFNQLFLILQLLFLSSFLLFKHLPFPLQFFNQLFLILLLLFLLQPLTAKVSDHLFKLRLAELMQFGRIVVYIRSG
ncbi:hypothetical protein GMOD_00010387 [Pyrenophora seminiperda CCB06]|uniref:Uncharacterized protein n=1 Tax=Pyrenophora seminiperda CCB06 TaxID=1302712 RepID=A0A3M7M5C8_9PLEO|nr:hypothetical protein GMOD_00010387 [Pyrenophora seminiperda CCB06]